MQFAPLYPWLYRLLAPTFPNCLWSGSTLEAKIALTFDDGPHPKYTAELLKVLDRYEQVASFFCLGSCVKKNPELTRETYQRGHWLGLHGDRHISFTNLNRAELELSLRLNKEAIANATNLELDKIIDVRPPNGLFSPSTLKQLGELGYRVVMWSVVPEDWVSPGIESIRRRVIAQVRNGANIVLHDGYYGGGEDVARNCLDLIPRLLDRGYQFVTVNELWQQSHVP